MNPQRPSAVLWLTGLPSAGKTTIARLLERKLAEWNVPVEVLDGDDIRELFPTTGFSRAERDMHVRRVGFTASRLEKHGVFAVVAMVSPHRESRDFVRQMCTRFIEIHISTNLAECERRDAKGLYARARGGELAGLTGIGDPYETPLAPELSIDTETLSADEAVARILLELTQRELVDHLRPTLEESREGNA